MKILVTGSRGFIGTRLFCALLKEGHEVFDFDSVNGQDLRDRAQVRRSVAGMDAVFHLAAVADLNWMRLYYEEAMDINIRGTVNVAVACRDAKAKLYFASTCCVYGHQNAHPTTEEAVPHPAELYAESKLAGESVVRGLYHTHGLEYNLMRFATVYGPGTRSAMGTHIFLRQALRGEPITVHGTGQQTRTLTYVDDLVGGMMALLRSGKMNEAWNLSIEEEVSAMRMAEDIKALTGSDSPIVHIPQRPGQTFKELISAQKMKREVGWVAETPWHTGIAKMYDWFLATNQVENRYALGEELAKGGVH